MALINVSLTSHAFHYKDDVTARSRFLIHPKRIDITEALEAYLHCIVCCTHLSVILRLALTRKWSPLKMNPISIIENPVETISLLLYIPCNP